MLSTFYLRVKGISLKRRSTCPQKRFSYNIDHEVLQPNKDHDIGYSLEIWLLVGGVMDLRE
jgi:hypothetical protein